MSLGGDVRCNYVQPQVNHNEWCLLYFISFLLLVGFFVLNMFVGVIVENFHKCRLSQENDDEASRRAALNVDRKQRSQSSSVSGVVAGGRGESPPPLNFTCSVFVFKNIKFGAKNPLFGVNLRAKLKF